MANYFIRVELRGTPSAEVYTTLHAHMQAKNFYQIIQGNKDGKVLWLDLPHAMYSGGSTLGAVALAGTLREGISASVWRDSIVLAIEWNGWGLSPA